MSESITQEISWTPVLEKYFKDTAEQAEGLGWMHGEAELLYSWRRTFIELPVAVGSGAIAFLNGASASLFEDAKNSSVWLGIASFAVGTLSSVNSYFGWAKRAEGHRIAALSYSKLNRFLSVELGLPREERIRPGDLLKMVKSEIDRLNETSPLVPTSIREKFKTRFKSAPVAKPPIANGLHEVQVFVDERPSLRRQDSFSEPPPPPPSE